MWNRSLKLFLTSCLIDLIPRPQVLPNVLRRASSSSLRSRMSISQPLLRDARSGIGRVLSGTLTSSGQSEPERDCIPQLYLTHDLLTKSKNRAIDEGFEAKSSGLANLHPARQLDIGNQEDWDALRREVSTHVPDPSHVYSARFDGVIMRELHDPTELVGLTIMDSKLDPLLSSGFAGTRLPEPFTAH